MSAPRSTPRCALLTAAAGEPLAGTAPTAVGWLALEQPGAWGRKAWTASDLDSDLGARLERAADHTGLRAVLVRRPGGGASADAGPRLLVACSRPGSSWLLGGILADPAEALRLDLDAVAAGDRDAAAASLPGLAPEDAPHLLVCANGTRDACCAVLGRPVAAGAAATHPGRVWETTHLSGHRFAPTAVVLPGGWTYGRLDAAGAARLLDEPHRVDLDAARGRSSWPAAGQAAEIAVRHEIGAEGTDDVVAVGPAGSREEDGWRVRTADASWLVRLTRTATGTQRPESCGKPDAPVTAYDVLGLRREP